MKSPSVLVAHDPGALLEREAELELVDRLLHDAPAGRGALLLFEGPAGIGKSRLLGAARERADALGFEVLRARGGELEQEFSHGVVRQLFEPRLAQYGEDERAALLSGAAALAAPLIEFAERGPVPTGDEDASFAMLHGLFWLTVNIADGAPVLIVVDDLHWCDSPSLRFLSYLARRLDGLRVVVVTSARPGEPAADVSLLAELESEPLATVVRPALLSGDAVAQLLGARLGGESAPEFRAAVYGSCGGNPLLLNELVLAVLAEGIEPRADAAERVRSLGPEALSRQVLQRLRRLGGPAVALARAVAVLGDGPDLALVADLAVLDLEEAAAATAALGRAEILRSRGSLGFAHPVLRTAVYEDLTEAERGLAHDRAAELLTHRGAPPQQVAAHLLYVAPRAREPVVATLREAARTVRAEGAADMARAYLVRALAEPPAAGERPDVLFELGAAELNAGVPGAIEHLEEAHTLLRGDPRASAVAFALGNALYAAGRLYDAADVLRRTIDDLEPEDPALAQRLEAQLIAWARFDKRLYPLASERLASSGAGASDETFGGRFLLALLASEHARAAESADEARVLAKRALAGGLLVGDENWQPFLLAVATLLTLDELDTAVRHLTEWLELARKRGSLFSFSHASSFRALAMLRRGDLRESEADGRAAQDSLPHVGGGASHVFEHLAETLLERGETVEATRVLELAGLDEEEPSTFQSARLLAVRARLRIEAGETERGLAELLAVGERLETLGVLNPTHGAWRSQAALLLLAKGDRDEARRLVGEEVALARRWGAPRALGAALRAAGLVEGDDDLLRESLEVLAESPAQLERAKSLTELGAALRRANRRAEARELLREGLELADRCGAAPVAERAHAELLATGARPRRIVRTGVDSLTPSEHRVARMAAEGQTNREIAQALFVTPKTIEMHLSHVYRKLDIQARSQLAAAMAGG